MIFVAIVRKPGLTRFIFCPRIYGEKFVCVKFHKVLLGSSPRMRGKAHAAGASGTNRNIIPAHAGKGRSWNQLMRR